MPDDMLTTGVAYCFVAIKDNVLHSIRTLCFPGRRHPDVLPARSNIAHYIVIVIRALYVCGGHPMRPWRASHYRINGRSSSLLKLLEVRYFSHSTFDIYFFTGTLQYVLTQQQSGRLTRAHTRNIDREDQFDSGLWELDDPMHGVEGIFFSN